MSDPSRFVFLPTVTTCVDLLRREGLARKREGSASPSSSVVEIEAKAGMEVVPVFISVDPERNNVEQVCEYVKDVMLNFCRRQAKVRIQCMRFTANVGFKEDQLPLYIEELFHDVKTLPRTGSQVMMAFIIMNRCLMNPNMEFVKFFGKNYDADALAEGVVKEIKACT
ncbi:SCO1/SenC [Musa troglodytarum]|uniref:SCO1/SenC n=1 Tax=Musa troglodytarum TaxID=320322 RepID=A0A9E7GE64_9LILI|nr:SCO1/SenC [Musa troglodytarum]